MPWKFACDLWFHQVLQTAIIRQMTKKKKRNRKNRKIKSKTVRIEYKSLCVLMSVWGV